MAKLRKVSDMTLTFGTPCIVHKHIHAIYVPFKIEKFLEGKTLVRQFNKPRLFQKVETLLTDTSELAENLPENR